MTNIDRTALTRTAAVAGALCLGLLGAFDLATAGTDVSRGVAVLEEVRLGDPIERTAAVLRSQARTFSRVPGADGEEHLVLHEVPDELGLAEPAAGDATAVLVFRDGRLIGLDATFSSLDNPMAAFDDLAASVALQAGAPDVERRWEDEQPWWSDRDGRHVTVEWDGPLRTAIFLADGELQLVSRATDA